MESAVNMTGLSAAALVAIGCNAFVAVLLFLLFLVLYGACKVPSSQDRVPALVQSVAEASQKNERKYLLTSS